MPVNGIELKEGQKWKTLSGRVATLQDNPRAEPYIFSTVYEDGEWGTVTKDGKCWASDYDSLLRELIYDPEQQVKEKLTMKFKPKSEPTKFAPPKPGDKIICNNGEEFICCTLGNLKSKGIASHLDDEVSIIFGISEHWEKNYSWMYWRVNNPLNDHEWKIRKVIPQNLESSANKKEEVKEEPRYSLQEIKEAWDASGWVSAISGWDNFQKNLTKINSPEYQEYLRLKAIYE